MVERLTGFFNNINLNGKLNGNNPFERHENMPILFFDKMAKFGAVSEKTEEILDDGTVIVRTPSSIKKTLPNGREIFTKKDSDENITTTITENGKSVTLHYDEDGNILTNAKQGETFRATGERVGIAYNTPEYSEYSELNPEAAKKGWFRAGGEVKIPAGLEDKVNINELDVDVKAEKRKGNEAYNEKLLKDEIDNSVLGKKFSENNLRKEFGDNYQIAASCYTYDDENVALKYMWLKSKNQTIDIYLYADKATIVRDCENSQFSLISTLNEQGNPTSFDKYDKINGQINTHISYDGTVNKNIIDKFDGITPNGELNGAFFQGNTGDCWLISALKAIANSPKGYKAIKEAMKVDKNGNVTVTFKGVGKTYTVLKKEIQKQNKLATGDLDARALEIAVGKCLLDVGYPEELSKIFSITSEKPYYNIYDDSTGLPNANIIEGNLPTTLYKLFFGKGKYKNISTIKADDRYIDELNNPNKISCFCLNNLDELKAKGILKDYKYAKYLFSNHAYANIASDENNVYFFEPNTGETFPMPRELYKKFELELDEIEL